MNLQMLLIRNFNLQMSLTQKFKNFSNIRSFGSTSKFNALHSCKLTSRGLLQLSGKDTPSFLQGLVTNDVNILMENTPAIQYCMMLNVQGRVLYDLFLYNITTDSNSNPTLLMECEATATSDLTKILKRYKLRKKVTIKDVSDDLCVWANFDPDQSTLATPEPPTHDRLTFADPRVPTFAYRGIKPAGAKPEHPETDPPSYAHHRFTWGLPEGSTDLPEGKCLPLESNLALMNGVSFSKGCYIGQELTARTHHTGVTRKRLMPLIVDGPVEPGADLSTAKGRSAGRLRACVGTQGLGLVRLAHVAGPLSSGDTGVKAVVPSWWPAGVLGLAAS